MEVALVGGLNDLRESAEGARCGARLFLNHTAAFGLRLRKTHRKLSDGIRKVPGTFLSTLSPFCGQRGLQIPIHSQLKTRAAFLSPRSAPRALQAAETGGIPRTAELWVVTVPKRPNVEGKKVLKLSPEFACY